MQKFTAVMLCGLIFFSCIAETKPQIGTYEISEKGKKNAEFMRESAMFYYYLRQKKTKEAVDTLQTILEKKTDSSYLIYWATNMYGDGIFPEEKMIEIARRHPESPLLCSNFAIALAGKGKRKAALEIVEKSLSYYLDPPAENEEPRGKKDKVMSKDFQLLLCTYLDFMIHDKTYDKGDILLKKVEKIYPLLKVDEPALIQLIEYYITADTVTGKKVHTEIRKKCTAELKKRLSQPNDFKLELRSSFILQLLKIKETELVEALLTEGLLTDPFLQSTYRNLLIYYVSSGQKHNMIRALSNEIVLFTVKEKRIPGHRLALLVMTAIDADDEMRVSSHIERVEKLGYLNEDLCYRVWVYYLEKGNVAKAGRYVSRIKNPVTKLLMTALTLSQEKRYGQALKLLLEIERDNPQNEFYKMLAAETAKKAGNGEIERQFLNEMLLKNKGNPDFQNFVGYTWAERGINLDQAETLIAAALKHSPNNYAYLDSMAWVAYKKGDYKRAKKYILKALANCDQRNSSGVLLDHAGDIFAAMNDRRSAMKYWQAAVQTGSVELDINSVLKKLPRPTAQPVRKVQNPESKADDRKNEPAAPGKKQSSPKVNKG